MHNTKSFWAFKQTMKDMLEASSSQSGYLWTFTFKEVLSAGEAMNRWHQFVHRGGHHQSNLLTCFPAMSGVRVIEQHPGRDRLFPEMSSHGFHFHLATMDFLNVDIMRSLWERLARGGRIHVAKVTPRDSLMYVGKYLMKQRGMFKGLRQWSAVGLAERTSARDIVVTSHWTDCYKLLKANLHGFAKLPWNTRNYLTKRFSMGLSIDEDLRGLGYLRGIEELAPKHLSQD